MKITKDELKAKIEEAAQKEEGVTISVDDDQIIVTLYEDGFYQVVRDDNDCPEDGDEYDSFDEFYQDWLEGQEWELEEDKKDE